MRLLNLNRDDATKVFSDIVFVNFSVIGYKNNDKYSALFNPHLENFGTRLKKYLKSSGVSFAWPNTNGAGWASQLTIAIINPEDYSMIKLMSNDFDITRAYILPTHISSFMFYLQDNDYDRFKDHI